MTRQCSVIVLTLVTNLVFLAVGATSSLFPEQPENPIVGIVSEPVTHSECVSIYSEITKNLAGGHGFTRHGRGHAATTSGGRNTTLPPVPNASGCIWSIYVDWLEASGIRVVPIPWDASDAQLEKLMSSVNGVMLAGGILGWVPSLHEKFFKVAQRIYNYVVERNSKGDPIVLWGTCQGFEMINAAAAGSFDVVKTGYVGMEPLMMEVNFTNYASNSSMYSDAPERILTYMQTENTTLNWHMYGIPPEEFLNNTRYNQSGLVPLTTTNDVAGRTFVSSVSSVIAEIYAVQFHPERVMFQFANGITHGPHAIEVSEYLSLFLAQRLKRNNHTFTSPEEAESYSIHQFTPFNLGWGVRVYNV